MSELHLDFAKAIRMKRKELGLTQTDLANRLGVQQRIVSRYEHGVFPKDNKVIDEVANALGLNLVVTINDSIDEILSASGYEIRWDGKDIIATKGDKCWRCSPVENPQV